MPWSNQNGGGGPWGGGGDKNTGGPWGGGGGNGGGPWGQGTRGPQRPGGGGGGGQPPDLEDIIRQGQDRLKRALPGGGGGGGRVLIGILVVGGLLLYAMQSFYQVDTDERAVELLFGQPKEQLSEPGLHFHFWPVETVETVNIAEKQVQIGVGAGNSGLMLSGDQNIVDVQFAVLYSVIDPADYLFNVAGPDGMVEQVAESAMREIVGRRPAQDVFRDNRAAIAEEVRSSMQSTLESYGAGININTVSIEDAAPPREVADAFEEVQRAEQDEDRFREEANQYSNQQLGQARGEAAQIREDAAAYATRVVQEAQGEAARFISIYDEYRLAPDVTRKRLFLETMEGVLANSTMIILDEQGQGSGVVPYLPLPEIQNRRTAAQTGGTQ